MKSNAPTFQKVRNDILGILLLGFSVFIGLSLYSFSPKDPSFNNIGNSMSRNPTISNYFGYIGSFLSDILYQFFGVSAWFFVILLMYLSFQYFTQSSVSVGKSRPIWGSLLMIISSSLLSMHFPNKMFLETTIPLGGILGSSFSKSLVQIFNPVGVFVILWFSFFALCVLFFEKTLAEFFFIFIGNFFKWTRFMISTPTNIKSGWRALDWMTSNGKKKAKKDPSGTSLLELSSPFEKGFFPLKSNSDLNLQISEMKRDESIREIAPLELDNFKMKFHIEKAHNVNNEKRDWALPKLSLMESTSSHSNKIDDKEIKKKSEILKDKLEQFGVTGIVMSAKPGPAVTLFEFKPDANVKLSRITELEDDLSLALSSESLRIIAPIPGRDVVGIETSNSHREIVYLRDLLSQESFWSEDIKLPIPLGKLVNGDPQIIDLRKMPHLMVAGTTGSGKSVFVVSILTSLIYKHSPQTLKLILMDPKQVDLAAFENLPHLIMPVVTDSKQAVMALKWAVQEMEKRYRSMSVFGARGLESYNEKTHLLASEEIEKHKKANEEIEEKSIDSRAGEDYYYTPQPYIAIIVEEFGDLMSVDKNNVEQYVVRLAQKARACGIHLILAMQSPRKEIITGLIKTNIPGRISFKVLSSVDSRIILDESGAERLLAQGDMLFRNPSGSNLIRYHAPFIKDSELSKIANFWTQQSKPEYSTSALAALHSSKDYKEFFDEDGYRINEVPKFQEFDERYDEILNWVTTQKEVSASLIQRRFQLGYPRAARMMETFEREGIVSPANGTKPRQVFLTK